jgi:hypothetical protein
MRDRMRFFSRGHGRLRSIEVTLVDCESFEGIIISCEILVIASFPSSSRKYVELVDIWQAGIIISFIRKVGSLQNVPKGGELMRKLSWN